MAAGCFGWRLLGTLSSFPGTGVGHKAAGDHSRLDGLSQGKLLPGSPRQSGRPRDAQLRNRGDWRLYGRGRYGQTSRDFWAEGEATVYFRNAKEASECARALLCSSAERRRLAAGLHRRIVNGAHTYAHRLGTMLEIASCR